MSELFDDEPGDIETRRRGGRARALVITGIVLILGFFALTTFASVYTDRLWYQEVGYSQVFSTMLWTRVGLFVVFGLLMAATVTVSMYLAYRFRPLFRLPGGDGSVDRYRDAVTPIRAWLLAGVGVVVGVFAGTSALGHWRTYLLWRHGKSFHQTDAYFHKDIGFYVFDLPWWHFLVDFVMAATVVAIIATAVVHYLYGGIRLQVQHDRLSGAAQAQLSVLLGVFVLAKGVDYYLDRFDLVTNDNSLFTGMNYTGENALLPARNILMGVAVICAILFFLNIWRRTWQLPSVGLALLVLSAVLLGMIWPAIVQNFQVNPTEADKEETYIQNNIDATRSAYDISDDTVEIDKYAGVTDKTATATQTTAERKAAADQLFAQLKQVPVIDPKQVHATFDQRQQLFAYYSVAPVLDVDRYQLNGEDEPLVLGVRELDQSGINADDKNWSNLHTVYTHGEGVIAAYANEIATDDTGSNGKVVWAEGLQSDNALSEADGGFEQRIYYGEQSPSYSIVGKASADDPNVELGLTLPSDATSEDEASEDKTTYDGKGGVEIGSTFRQLMYAVKFGEPNFLLSGRVNSDSKVLYNRDPQTRVEQVAPWLTVDGDPYPAVIDGRIQWILDGYTTTDRYPNSQRASFESMIDDSLQENTGLQTVPTDEINYMRSAVKATVDAYDGTVTLYAWDEDDPILQTWEDVFPGSVKPRSAISPDLMAHLRYPEDLFKVQRYQLAKYHVTDASDFYQGSLRWEVAKDPNLTNSFQPPYRVFTPAVNGSGSEWSLTSVFTPRGKDTVASFASVNSDATDTEGFGKIHLLELDDPNAPAPGQVANSMSADEDVRTQLLKYSNSGQTPPIYGNLLTLPVNDGLIYIEPVYAVRTLGDSSYPIIQFVIVSYNGNVGIGENLALALSDSLGVSKGTTTPPDGNTDNPDGDNTDNPDGNDNPDGDGGTVKQQIAEELDAADRFFTQADEAKAAGNIAKWARLIDKAQEHFEAALALMDDPGAPGQKPTATP
ncbi:UPF0182 family protein [Nocardioides sp. MH1]|uniref:UPF0182 family membrane protein n=1 Tax=Nocardioides sp. MH1 TaxID=3242490 RepID=UPI0035200B8B